jgi:flagellar basal-body rod protein FlgC
MDLQSLLRIAGAGIDAQNTRLRAIAENIANADSAPSKPGEDPYRRKLVQFRNVLDKELGAPTVRADRMRLDQKAFPTRYDPHHPAADERGYVRMPNVNTLIETMDMRQAQRSYEANLGVIEIAKSMISRTIEILRG